MNQLQEVVKNVLHRTRESGNPVTETLAAYVAMTIVNSCTVIYF